LAFCCRFHQHSHAWLRAVRYPWPCFLVTISLALSCWPSPAEPWLFSGLPYFSVTRIRGAPLTPPFLLSGFISQCKYWYDLILEWIISCLVPRPLTCHVDRISRSWTEELVEKTEYFCSKCFGIS
jgi:hypothetical protein